jgi:hypothetical protein
LVCYAFETQKGIVLPWVPTDGVEDDGAIRAVVSAAHSHGWRRADDPLREWDVLRMRGIVSGRRHVGLGVRANGKIMVLHADGEQTDKGCTGTVRIETMDEIRGFYKEIELWRKT